MYDFQPIDSFSPSSDYSSVAVNLDGVKLDQVIPHFRTISVEGRELIEYQTPSLDNIPGRTGAIVMEQTLPPRVIRVRFMIEAPNNQEFRSSFNELNRILYSNSMLRRTSESKITFDDEPNFIFEGYPQGVEEPPGNLNSIVAGFTLYCPNPFKYSSQTLEYTLSGTTRSVGAVGPGSTYPLKLVEIKVTTVATNKITISNGVTGRKIVLNHTFLAGQILSIKPNSITLNGLNIMSKLDFVESDWNDFKIFLGDTIDTIPEMTRTVYVQEQML